MVAVGWGYPVQFMRGSLQASYFSCKIVTERASVHGLMGTEKGKTTLPLAPLSIGTPYPFAGMLNI